MTVTDRARTFATTEVLRRVEAQLTPKYVVDFDGRSVTVSVPAPFRMQGGKKQRRAEEVIQVTKRALVAAGQWPRSRNEAGALNEAILRNAYGRPEPEQITLVTQRLIDGGLLEPYLTRARTESSTKTPEQQAQLAIRRLQWDHGLGIDCNGVGQVAFLALTGVRPNAHWGNALIATTRDGSSLSSRLRRVTVAEAQPGDLIKLDDVDGDVGHNVVVLESSQIPEDVAQALVANPAPRGALQKLTVLSSWGADGDQDSSRGGVRRALWVWDATAEKWGTMTGPTITWSTESGPYDHRLVGVYRARSACGPTPCRRERS